MDLFGSIIIGSALICTTLFLFYFKIYIMKIFGIIRNNDFSDTIFGQTIPTYRPKSGKVEILISINNKTYSKFMDIKKVEEYRMKVLNKMNLNVKDTDDFYNRFNQCFAICAKMIKC